MFTILHLNDRAKLLLFFIPQDLIYEHKTLLENASSESPKKGAHSLCPPSDPNFHRNDDQVHVQLEPGSDSLKPLSLKFLRLSSKATVTHIRKYVAQQILNDISKFNEVRITFILFFSPNGH